MLNVLTPKTCDHEINSNAFILLPEFFGEKCGSEYKLKTENKVCVRKKNRILVQRSPKDRERKWKNKPRYSLTIINSPLFMIFISSNRGELFSPFSSYYLHSTENYRLPSTKESGRTLCTSFELMENPRISCTHDVPRYLYCPFSKAAYVDIDCVYCELLEC